MPAGDEGRLVARSPEQVIDVFAAAVNSGDIERVLAIYERNARLAFPGRPYVGHDAIRVDLQNLLSQKPVMRGSTLSVSQVRDLALLRSEWSYIGTGPAGERIELSGESAELARQQPDGTWLYVIDLPMGRE
jgi:ketosteroid isomerase-like protein